MQGHVIWQSPRDMKVRALMLCFHPLIETGQCGSHDAGARWVTWHPAWHLDENWTNHTNRGTFDFPAKDIKSKYTDLWYGICSYIQTQSFVCASEIFRNWNFVVTDQHSRMDIKSHNIMRRISLQYLVSRKISLWLLAFNCCESVVRQNFHFCLVPAVCEKRN